MSEQHGDLRVSDADRERTVGALRDHVASGRLTFEEFNERVDLAYGAKTSSDLARALDGLPVDRPAAAPAAPRRRSWWGRGATGAVRRWVSFNAFFVAIWGATSIGAGHGPHYFWPIWIMIPSGVMCLRHAARANAPGEEEHEHHEVPPRQRYDHEAALERVVMSVLFVDIVSSTKHAVAMGDAAWREVADDYERRAAGEIHRRGGTTLFTKGDEVVAGFPSPAAAVTAAEAIRDQAQDLGLHVRAGIHAGEVNRRGDRADGIAMHIGRRVCEAAAADQVLVSSTVRDLLNGSDISFTSAGQHELKGLDGTWALFEPLPLVAG